MFPGDISLEHDAVILSTEQNLGSWEESAAASIRVFSGRDDWAMSFAFRACAIALAR